MIDALLITICELQKYNAVVQVLLVWCKIIPEH